MSSPQPRFLIFAIAELNPLKLSELSIQHAAICLWAGWAGLCTVGHRTATGGYKTYCRERSAVAFYVSTKETKGEVLFVTFVVLVAGCDVQLGGTYRHVVTSQHVLNYKGTIIIQLIICVVTLKHKWRGLCWLSINSVRVAECFVFLHTVCVWPSVLCVYTACGRVFCVSAHSVRMAECFVCLYTVCIWPSVLYVHSVRVVVRFHSETLNRIRRKFALSAFCKI
jgi:hypothetical protein